MFPIPGILSLGKLAVEKGGEKGDEGDQVWWRAVVDAKNDSKEDE